MDWSWNPGSDLRTCLSLLVFFASSFSTLLLSAVLTTSLDASLDGKIPQPPVVPSLKSPFTRSPSAKPPVAISVRNATPTFHENKRWEFTVSGNAIRI